MDKCESCKIKNVEVIDPYLGSAIPFKVCNDCYKRLLSYSLRPLEYFNLVSVHGFEYHLNDDFYWEDGTATQPETKVKNSKDLSFPKLADIKTSLDNLIDFAIVKWDYPLELNQFLKEFSDSAILKRCDEKLNVNPFLIDRLLPIAVNYLKKSASEWLKYQIASYEGDEPFIFSEAIANCLGLDEGFDMVTNMIMKESPKSLDKFIWNLIFFRTEKVSDWIEENSDQIINIKSNYGDVCAINGFTWDRAERWLRLGRPLSLIALDALIECGTTFDKQWRSFHLRTNPVKLINPPSKNEAESVLNDYLQKDNVHRTRNAVKVIIEEWNDIVN